MLAFPVSPRVRWAGNFRELTASVTRLATLADGGRITEDHVIEELARLEEGWDAGHASDASAKPLGERANDLDLLDRCHFNAVIETCRSSSSLSAAGRTLFAASRQAKKDASDADRLRKYLQRFGLSYEMLRGATERS